jgi:hypothetical protein
MHRLHDLINMVVPGVTFWGAMEYLFAGLSQTVEYEPRNLPCMLLVQLGSGQLSPRFFSMPPVLLTHLPHEFLEAFRLGVSSANTGLP